MCDVVVPRELRLLKALIPLEERALACPDRLCRGADSSTDSNGALACPDVLCRGPRCSVQGRRPSSLVQDVLDGALACPSQWTWAEAIMQGRVWMARLSVRHSGQGRRPCGLGTGYVLGSTGDMRGYEC